MSRSPANNEGYRRLTDHITNPANEKLIIEVVDEVGGVGRTYRIGGFQNPSHPEGDGWVQMRFQDGPLKEVGVNGITHEALLAIVIDRLRGFQAGSFACRENDLVLIHCEAALRWFQKRTQGRGARGVEGTYKK